MSQHGGTGFLDLPEEARDPRTAGVHVLCIPYEATVSYETGTAKGPEAIIEASRQVELYDESCDSEPPLSYGIHTLPALRADFPTGEAMAEAVACAVQPIVAGGKLPLVLGGEHSISPGAVRGALRAAPGALDVVQIDAHADLRDSYNGSRFSHACAMRRILDEISGRTVQIGIRSWSREEADFMRATRGRVNIISAARMARADPAEILREAKGLVAGRRIYLTIDVDGLDPSVIPATGTPEPGGLSWWQARGILRGIVEAAAGVVGVDCVELAPRNGLHMSEYAAARLLAELLNAIMAKRQGSRPPEHGGR